MHRFVLVHSFRFSSIRNFRRDHISIPLDLLYSSYRSFSTVLNEERSTIFNNHDNLLNELVDDDKNNNDIYTPFDKKQSDIDLLQFMDFQRDDYTKSMEIFSNIKNQNKHPSIDIYKKMINICLYHKKFLKASTLYQNMLKNYCFDEITPDFHCTMLRVLINLKKNKIAINILF